MVYGVFCVYVWYVYVICGMVGGWVVCVVCGVCMYVIWAVQRWDSGFELHGCVICLHKDFVLVLQAWVMQTFWIYYVVKNILC